MLFGLKKWILKTWVDTREYLVKSDARRDQNNSEPNGHRIMGVVRTGTAMEFMRNSTRELTLTLQAVSSCPLSFRPITLMQPA